MDYIRLSKEVSYALRHAPWEYELEMDEQGFVPIEQLLTALNEGEGYGRPVTREDFEHIIEASDKERYRIAGDQICALYGHSFSQRIAKELADPPAVLYHGTSRMALPSILQDGLKPMGRQYVHLSVDTATATTVGRRHDSQPVVLTVDAPAASAAGYTFYRGNDKVWLADSVPPAFLAVRGGW